MIWSVKIRARRLQDASKTPQDAPTWCPRRPKSHPKGTQDASRTGQELPKRRPGGCPEVPWSQGPPKSRPRAAQETPKSRPAPLRTSILDHFGDDFKSFDDF